MDLELLRGGLITFLLLIASLAIHEWAHAWVADTLGDDTPRRDGRVTLNPMAHIDLFGTVIIPLVNIFVLRSVFSLIGWGRPVRVNPSNFSHRTRDEILVSMAGPCANLLVALGVVVVGALAVPSVPLFADLVHEIVVMNVGLAVFNLLPIPPLDGGTLLRHLSGMSEETYMALARWSGIVMLVLINLRPFLSALYVLFGLACVPLYWVCGLINPQAARLIFLS